MISLTGDELPEHRHTASPAHRHCTPCAQTLSCVHTLSLYRESLIVAVLLNEKKCLICIYLHLLRLVLCCNTDQEYRIITNSTSLLILCPSLLYFAHSCDPSAHRQKNPWEDESHFLTVQWRTHNTESELNSIYLFGIFAVPFLVFYLL